MHRVLRVKDVWDKIFDHLPRSTLAILARTDKALCDQPLSWMQAMPNLHPSLHLIDGNDYMSILPVQSLDLQYCSHLHKTYAALASIRSFGSLLLTNLRSLQILAEHPQDLHGAILCMKADLETIYIFLNKGAHPSLPKSCTT